MKEDKNASLPYPGTLTLPSGTVLHNCYDEHGNCVEHDPDSIYDQIILVLPKGEEKKLFIDFLINRIFFVM
jgi:hypothetical protein